MKKYILASKSPRRKELLSLIGIDFEICVAETDEFFDPNKKLEDALLDVAFQKANCILEKHPDATIISADTIVVYDNQVLGKPKDEEDAFQMLKLLSNHTHRVLTGVCVLEKDNKHLFYEETFVKFYDLDDEMIKNYIETKEPMDKAGAYGIQQKGSILVEKIDGDYFNVVGLPIAKLYRVLKGV